VTAIFLAAFLGGLVLSVYAMIRGVERPPHGGTENVDALGRALQAARTSLRAPVASAGATLFGATGYLLTRYTSLSVAPRLTIAIIAGFLGIVGAILLIAKWVIPSAQHDVVDERYLLQGHFARVTEPITAGATGRIQYELGGTHHAAVAQSLDGSPVPANTEVVIERVEEGVAYVEPWKDVEQRI
jgi:membrane protein implicated in regulation of membrane protease activity